MGMILSVCLKSYFIKTKRLELNKESYPISVAISNYLNLKENSGLINLQNIINVVADAIEGDIFIADNLGYIYAMSNKNYEDKKFSNIGVTQEEIDYLKEGNIIEKNRVNDEGKKEFIYIKGIFQEDYFCGIEEMIIPRDGVYEGLIEVFLIIWISIIVTIVVILMIIKNVIKKMVIIPINEMNMVAKKLATGEVNNRIEVKTNDEIGMLAQSFNVMADSLEKTDRTRKDFISNISHELRSPITSIKGFITGILDGVIPKDKENYYLNIVSDEINRLSRLVDDLLDIAALENNNYKFNKMEIDINTLIKLCVVNKENRIVEKDLNVEVLLENEHQFVLIDRDRIIQVITNILDNAIKYSYQKGNIKIITKCKGDKIYVNIKNQGPTLSEEDMIKIWDRFYKVDKSRTNKESTGLGLPIVRSILTQHKEDIWVQNEKDGVSFTFTLTRVEG